MVETDSDLGDIAAIKSLFDRGGNGFCIDVALQRLYRGYLRKTRHKKTPRGMRSVFDIYKGFLYLEEPCAIVLNIGFVFQHLEHDVRQHVALF